MPASKVRFVWHGRRLTGDVLDAAEDSLDEAAQEVVRDAKQFVAVDTGRLRTSIRASLARNRGGKIEVEITADAKNQQGEEYGAYVEKGTRNRKPQPFLEPAAERMDLELVPELRKRLRRIR